MIWPVVDHNDAQLTSSLRYFPGTSKYLPTHAVKIKILADNRIYRASVPLGAG